MEFAQIIEAFIHGLTLVFQWQVLGFLLSGIMIGIVMGVIPGLGGIVGMVILLPFVYGMDTVPAFALLLGMFAVTTTSDTISSVLLGIPGTAGSQATILDGYPLAQKGQAARAFGAAFTVSAFGGVFGALVLAISMPLVMPLILAFGSAEMFMLGVLGLSMVGSLSGGSVLKGLVAALFGLLMAMVGDAESFAISRYVFGTDYLIDGLGLLPVILGLFAIPELMDLALKDTSIAKVSKDQVAGGGIFDGVKDALANWWLVLRCSIIGTYIGMLPGLGAGVVDWIAYGHAVQSAKDSSKFGKGDIRGVIAPEAANNALKGGVLIPTIAFGIPGGPAAAILLGALLIMGLRPGPEMVTTKLHITFSMVWMIAVANIVAAGLLMASSKQVAKLAFISGHLIVPGVMMFLFMGAWVENASMGSWITLLIMGAIGFIMKIGNWPRSPIILAIILGNYLENYFQISIGAYDGFSWLVRPIVLVIIGLITITLVFSSRAVIKRKKMKNRLASSRRSSENSGENAKGKHRGAAKNAVFSFLFTIALCVLFIWAGFESLKWPFTVKMFPLAIVIPAVVMVLISLFFDTRILINELKVTGSMMAAMRKASEEADLLKAFQYFGYLIGVILITFLVGQKIALPLFVLIYLIRWGGYGMGVSLGYALVVWISIVGFYDQIMHMFWHPSWLSSWLPALLPGWFPAWLII